MKKLLALLMAFTLTFQLVTPVFAEEIEETQAATEAVEVETEAPTTEIPTTEPPPTETPETIAPEETSASTEPQTTTEATEVTETTASTEETTTAVTEPTEETTEPTLELFTEDENVIAAGTCGYNGDNLTWALTEDGTLTISGSGEMEDYSDSSVAPWFAKRTKILSAVVEDGVTSIGGGAFYACLKLTSVTLPESIKSIGYSSFLDCTKLAEVTIPDGVTSIGYSAFRNCSNLISVTIPEGVTSIGDYAFSGCSSLTSVTIPESVTSIESSAFYGCSSLRSILVDKDNANFTSIDGVLFDKACTSLITYPARKSGAAYQIPEGVTSIGYSAFEDCSNLTSVTIPEGVTSIGYDAFRGCSSLTSVTIPESVTSIEISAFSGCSSLTSVTIPEGVTSIEWYAFEGCSSLTSVTIPDGVTSIGSSAFSGCSSLTSVTIPEGVTSIGHDAFYGCSSLASVAIPEGVTNIGELAFCGCRSLTSVTIPEGVTSICESAFCGCRSLTSVTIPEGVTSIGRGAFGYCQKLSKLWLPKTITLIDDDAFSDCGSLKSIYYGGSELEWNQITIKAGNDALKKARRICGVTEAPHTEIRPVDTTALTSDGKLTLTAWAMPDRKKVKANWSLASGDEVYAAISGSGVLTAKTVNEVQNVTVIAMPTDGSPEARKEIQILPKITAKQVEKFNLFHSYSRAELAITGGKVDYALLDGNKDFVLENENDHFYIRFADPENPPAKPNTKATLQVFFPGSDTPVTKALTIRTTNTAPKLKLNPTSSILNTTLVDGLEVAAEVLGTEDESLEARSATKGVTATVENGKLVVKLDTAKTTTATLYFKGNDWAKEVKLTHKITVTDKKPTVKFTAKGKLDVLNPASEIVYTPKLTNATGTITDVRLEGVDAKLFNAKVVDGLIHLTMKDGCKYATKKTYKIMPVVTLLGNEIEGPTLSVKVTQSALKLAKIPNQTVSLSNLKDLTVHVQITSPAWADIDRMTLDVKSSAAFRNAFECFHFVGGAVTFPASTFASLKPGRYAVILDVFPANAASDTAPAQAKFTLTVQK